MEKVEMKVEGMSCTNCALTIDKYLKEQGLQNVKVNFIGGDVSFDMLDNTSVEAIEKGIYKLGYTVKNDHQNSNSKQTYYGFLPFKNNLQRFWFCF
ncbi:MAG TPA: heavy metal-associated domain-containing protein, partial [Chitinophagaceae bacterium]|nr:heavy metal-associated domain-containing protein [Chitinophagaceae bacterium]